MTEAEHLMVKNKYEVISSDVLKLAELSGCSAYDCEFVSLAKHLGISLITSDKKILKSFPQYAISLKEYSQ